MWGKEKFSFKDCIELLWRYWVVENADYYLSNFKQYRKWRGGMFYYVYWIGSPDVRYWIRNRNPLENEIVLIKDGWMKHEKRKL